MKNKKKNKIKTKYKYKYRLLKREDKRLELQTRRFFVWFYVYCGKDIEVFENKIDARTRIKQLEYKPEKIEIY